MISLTGEKSVFIVFVDRASRIFKWRRSSNAGGPFTIHVTRSREGSLMTSTNRASRTFKSCSKLNNNCVSSKRLALVEPGQEVEKD